MPLMDFDRPVVTGLAVGALLLATGALLAGLVWALS